MVQQGQVFQLIRCGPDGERLWAYRYRTGGRDSKRVQRGGFALGADARDALERELERLRREARIARRLTLDELVETYLAQHDAWGSKTRSGRSRRQWLVSVGFPV